MIEAFIKGFALGLLLVFSVGPVIFTIIKQSINHGKKGGFSFVAGVWFSDIIWVVLSNGFSEIIKSLLSFKVPIGIAGSLFLIAMGIYFAFIKKIEPKKQREAIEIEGDEIIVDGYFQFDPSPTMGPEATIDQRMFRFLDLYAMQSKPYRWRLNMKTGAVREGLLSDTVTEFGMINPQIVGKKYDYVYSVVPTEGWFTFEGLIKHNVTTGEEETFRLPSGVYASESVFAPRPNSRSEDDGYLITFTMDVVNDVSHCEIFDALRLSDGPVARIKLPERICSGTHAYWADAATLTPQG